MSKINATFKPEKPDEQEFTATITMSLENWKAVRDRIGGEPHYTACGEMSAMIKGMVEVADTSQSCTYGLTEGNDAPVRKGYEPIHGKDI